MIKFCRIKRRNNGTVIVKNNHKLKSAYKPSYTHWGIFRLKQYLNHIPQDIKLKKN